MANTVRIKISTGSSAPTRLANAELAHAEGSDIIFIGKGTGGAGGSATTIEKIGGKGAFFDKDTVQNANKVLGGPTSGSDAAPTFRALVSDDIPSLAHTKISDFDTGVRVNRLDQMAAPTGSVSLNIHNFNLMNVDIAFVVILVSSISYCVKSPLLPSYPTFC